jgi:exosortase A-associated hydrolase 2
MEVFYLPLQDGPRLCVLHRPDRAGREAGAFVYVHPFADEMNKTRRMAALQSRALAAAGWFVLQIDLFGCGDSQGDFGDATWPRWIDDVIDASSWLNQQCGFAPMLWGTRLGCLLAAEASHRMPSPPNLLFWQPVVSGRRFMQQFLRVKLATQLLGGGDRERQDTEHLRQQLVRGESVEIGGYHLSPALALAIDKCELSPPKMPARVAWFEILGGPELSISPGLRSRLEAWQGSGVPVDVHAIGGPAFWQTQELAECRELVEASVSAVESWRR